MEESTENGKKVILKGIENLELKLDSIDFDDIITNIKKQEIERIRKIQNLAKELDIYFRKIPTSSKNFDNWFNDWVKTKFPKLLKTQLPRIVNKLHIKTIDDDFGDKLYIKAEDIKKKLQIFPRSKEKIITISKDIRLNKKIKSKLKDAFKEIEKWISEKFLELSNDEQIKSLNIKFGIITDISVTPIIEYKSGKDASPNLVLSEANLDLLGLLFFLAMIKTTTKERKSQLLILDDVLQSIDSQIRLKLTSMIREEFQNYQIIISTHDRLWFEQMANIFQFTKGKFQPVKLNFNPITQRYILDGIDSEFKIKINDDVSTIQIAQDASYLLEKICHYLSYNIKISVVRKKDDRYTIGDIWPGLFKELKKTNLNDIVLVLNDFLLYRNVFAVHFNEWTLNTPRNDIINFAQSVQQLFDSTFCTDCGRWIEKSMTTDCLYTCRCTSKKLNNK